MEERLFELLRNPIHTGICISFRKALPTLFDILSLIW